MSILSNKSVREPTHTPWAWVRVTCAHQQTARSDTVFELCIVTRVMRVVGQALMMCLAVAVVRTVLSRRLESAASETNTTGPQGAESKRDI